MTRSLHLEPRWPFFALRHMNSLSAGQERSKMTRSLHFKPGWHISRDLEKKRSNGKLAQDRVEEGFGAGKGQS